ncbi:hypothetical protein H257_07809 [Aphanomyces astaci]|uniref:Uncharacterized protein n=2 Tax=Aphanomyces astaci TaxID=112090 RepID=W4GJ65_APHAT|nr:hypothetical protein H257_07809 [Aphanomyces astaci]ETV79044.1 hypothetical protein H257_07809 [Aphanomyces astaci]RHY08975.1 hypothetical protein DYB25_008922 [Aphanomyces astaci]RHY10557.1 hypothetical protein DYB36_008993 [Aphanomyces astaci]RHY46473.1 hypothetical protein DYB38_004440 [Aphanomyces astaci]RHY67325.1 hypothetical protein DYB30_002496 [Aphanomyces astaci]|eukprot:XP_009831763.1 hypothetical protein H257_07809 [Aphanomyces astaci]
MPTAPAAATGAKEVDYVSKQANLTAQIESERMAAKRWWQDYGQCYIDNSKPEDFTYENRIKMLQEKLASEKTEKNARLQTTSGSYGIGAPFKECTAKKLPTIKK